MWVGPWSKKCPWGQLTVKDVSPWKVEMSKNAASFLPISARKLPSIILLWLAWSPLPLFFYYLFSSFCFYSTFTPYSIPSSSLQINPIRADRISGHQRNSVCTSSSCSYEFLAILACRYCHQFCYLAAREASCTVCEHKKALFGGYRLLRQGAKETDTPYLFFHFSLAVPI